MNIRSGQTASAAHSSASGWTLRTQRWARTAWTPAWLDRRPRPVRIAIRTDAIVLLIMLSIRVIQLITKRRNRKGPFERQVEIEGDFQLYFAPFNVKFYAEDIRIANPAWAREKRFFTAKKVDTRLATLPLLFGDRILRFADLDGAQVMLA